MNKPETLKLLRDCKAMLIPSGRDVILSKDMELALTHCLGGYYTVRGVFGMARIADSETDALYPANDETLNSKPTTANASEAEPQEKDLWDIAKTVFDPEIPVNIVDLGLVYRLVFAEEDGLKTVQADMTLTTTGCAMGPMIADDLRQRLEAIPGVARASVNIVWDPPWNQDMMSEEARMILGLA